MAQTRLADVVVPAGAIGRDVVGLVFRRDFASHLGSGIRRERGEARIATELRLP